MESFTSLEQSKILAEILPLESADMHYNNASIKGINYVDEHRAELMEYNRAIKVLSKYTINPLFEVVPCWSLGTLLCALCSASPKAQSIHLSENLKDNFWYVELLYSNEDKDNYCGFGSSNNPIDACIELLLKIRKHTHKK